MSSNKTIEFLILNFKSGRSVKADSVFLDTITKAMEDKSTWVAIRVKGAVEEVLIFQLSEIEFITNGKDNE